jgi:hypothetical protein
MEGKKKFADRLRVHYGGGIILEYEWDTASVLMKTGGMVTVLSPDTMSRASCSKEVASEAALYWVVKSLAEEMEEEGTFELLECPRCKTVVAVDYRDFGSSHQCLICHGVELLKLPSRMVPVGLKTKLEEGVATNVATSQSKAKGDPTEGEDVISLARRLTDSDRPSEYGPPEDCFRDIAGMWSEYLGYGVSARDVTMMMILLKICRDKFGKKKDNLVDIIGYARCADLLNQPDSELSEANKRRK